MGREDAHSFLHFCLLLILFFCSTYYNEEEGYMYASATFVQNVWKAGFRARAGAGGGGAQVGILRA